MRRRLLIVATVPQTLATILRDQPRFLSHYFDVQLATSEDAYFNDVISEGVPVHVVKMVRRISVLKDLISLWDMYRLLRRIRPDIVHSYTPKAGLVSILAAFLTRVPVRVHTFTGLLWPTASGFRKKLLMAMDRLLCFCATHVVPEGLGVQDDLIYGAITHKHLQVIGYGNIAGVDVAHYCRDADGVGLSSSILREELCIQASQFVYIYVGRICRDKGLAELMSAFAALPDHCRLLIVGDFDTSDPVSVATKHAFQNDRRVHLLGFQRDIRPALGLANVLVLPSYREGFPNILLQAGAMSLPAIVTDISGCNEVIEPGFNGWLVPPADAMSLHNAMRRVLDIDCDSLSEMGGSARARIVDRFDRYGYWTRLLHFYRALSSGRRAHSCTKTSFVLVASQVSSIINFRSELVRALQGKGFEVHVVVPVAPSERLVLRRLYAMGLQVHCLPLRRLSFNPIVEISTFLALIRILSRIHPRALLSYTIKPVLYGSLAARVAGVPHVYSLITGRGSLFVSDSIHRCHFFLVRCLYYLSLAFSSKVFFQNPDDLAFFRKSGLLQFRKPTCLVNGSGVDTAHFDVRPLPDLAEQGEVRFLMIARFLRSKGVFEYIEAARLLQRAHPNARCAMLGWFDQSPDAIAEAELDGWLADGHIDFLGFIDDVRPVIAACNVFVMPSYCEGTPRVVLEAMSVGRAIITTDVPGCRETVVNGYNGFLVPARDAMALAQAMCRFIEQPGLQITMGACSRQIAVRKYDVHKVTATILAELELE